MSNEITTLPTLPVLPNVNTLILSRNRITSLPATLPSSLPALKKLSIAHNALSSKAALPDFTSCTSLREVRLNGNPTLGALPEHIQRWGKGKDAKAPGLELLDLADCGLDSWEALAPLLEEGSAKNGRKGLRNLNLRGNAVATADPEAFEAKLLEVHPTIRTLNNRNLVADKRSVGEKVPQPTGDRVPRPSEGAERAVNAEGNASLPSKKRKRDHKEERSQPQAPSKSEHIESKHQIASTGGEDRSASEANQGAAGQRKHKRGVRGGSSKRQKVQGNADEGDAEGSAQLKEKDEEVRSDDEGGEPTYFFQKKKSRASASAKQSGPQLLESEDVEMVGADAEEQQPSIETAPSGNKKPARKGEQGKKGKASGKGPDDPKPQNKANQKGKAPAKDQAHPKRAEQVKELGKAQIDASAKPAKASQKSEQSDKQKAREAASKPSVSELLSGSTPANGRAGTPQAASAPKPPATKAPEAGNSGQSAVVGIIDVKGGGRKKRRTDNVRPENSERKPVLPTAQRNQTTIGGGGDSWGDGGSAW